MTTELPEEGEELHVGLPGEWQEVSLPVIPTYEAPKEGETIPVEPVQLEDGNWYIRVIAPSEDEDGT